MRSAVLQNGDFTVVDGPDLKPAKGQVTLKVLRCGICGSDLHLRRHCDAMSEHMSRLGYGGMPRQAEPLVLGHEFCGEVLDYGPQTPRALKPGTRVCAVPMIIEDGKPELTGLARKAPGAYAEQVLADAKLILPVPNGLDADRAALAEPMAVAWHAVRRGELKSSDVAIVVGAGPVGLSVIAMLKAKGVKHVIASDFSAARRELARQCGADLVIDPAKDSPFADWKAFGFINDVEGLLELSYGTLEALDKSPLPWWTLWSLVDKLGLGPKRPVVFECVGVPGVIESLIESAPSFTRIVVVGLCMEEDRIQPALAIGREIELRFVFGYSPLEYRQALHLIAEGKAVCDPLITGEVGLDGVAAAFDALAHPEQHAKILINPASKATAPAPPRSR